MEKSISPLTLELNIADFLTEFFTGNLTEKDSFSYGLLWEAIQRKFCTDKSVRILIDSQLEEDSDFYYEYGLLKAEEEMQADHFITEKQLDGLWLYKFTYYSAKRVTFKFYTETRLTVFIEHENEIFADITETAEQLKHLNDRTVLCLESEQELFKRACREITDAIQANYYDNIEDFECPNCTEVIEDWMEYGTEYSWMGDGCSPIVLQAVDHAFQWFLDGINAGLIYKQIKK